MYRNSLLSECNNTIPIYNNDRQCPTVVDSRIKTVLKCAYRRKTVIFVINNNCDCSVIRSRGGCTYVQRQNKCSMDEKKPRSSYLRTIILL